MLLFLYDHDRMQFAIALFQCSFLFSIEYMY